MELFLDEKPLDYALLGGGTLEDGLRGVQSHVGERRILVGFRCDGRDIAEPAMASVLRRPVASFERVELFSSTREDVVFDTMTHASTSLEETEAVTRQIAEMLVEGRTPDAVRQLGDCLRVWQSVHDAVTKSLALFEIDVQALTVRGVPVSDALTRPREVLVQIKQALLAQDYVLLADILQYEFAEVTDLWHSMIALLHAQAQDRRTAKTV